MAQTRGDRSFSFQNLLKMLISPSSATRPTHDEAEGGEDLDEPPDHHHILHATPVHQHESIEYVRPQISSRKESLLTRALRTSPEPSPTDQHHSIYDSTYHYRSYPHSNISGISTAELTSDGGMTSPSLSNTPSPPLPPQMMGKPSMASKKEIVPRLKVVDTSETTVEANLGRKRCISFACGRKAETTPEPKPTEPTSQPATEPANEPPKRKSALTFVCPGRQPSIQRERSPVRKTAFRSRCRGSPAPANRKVSPAPVRKVSGLAGPSEPKSSEIKQSESKIPETTTSITLFKGIPTSGLGLFEESEATRFHEFASSTEDDEEWVKKATDFPEKITLNDCMKKENAIRQLGEEADAEALEEDDDAEDIADDDSTIHDFSSDDGNESDNEAGFADSDDSDDDGSDYEFWAPSIIVSDGSNVQPIDVAPPVLERRASNTCTSFDSLTDDHQKWLPAPVQRMAARRSAPKPIKMRPGTPNLPDSTDFVCGTLDEDRPLEVAYKSCLEQRRLSKRVVIPQDIDPSFPTSDPEDNGDLEDVSQDHDDGEEDAAVDSGRGRADAVSHKSPLHSPKRIMSPPPPTRWAGRSSPKRLKSPPPRARAKSPVPDKWALSDDMPIVESPRGLNISHLVQQRQPMIRTKSLPRTPNPFFATDQSYRSLRNSSFTESHECAHSRTRELHTRGPIDIVEGLEKKRQKRKEKFWRQHCRKNAKEQIGRRPIPGKGAERMKELGLEIAERTRAYGVGQDDTQLVLSV